jgi:ankyrin repeat protein
MQKVIFLIISLLLLSTGCARSGSHPASREETQRFLKLRGYDFDEKSFFAAAQARDVMAINAFLDAGINGNAQDADGRTVLSAAAARGDLEILNKLLSRGVDPNVKDKRGYTALSHAVEAKHEDVVDVLLNRPEVDPNSRGLNSRPVLMAFVWREDKARVEKVIARGADVNAQDADRDTALHGAAQSTDVEILKMLLDKGANPNVKNSSGGTPLMWAAVYGNHDAAQLLLSRGADTSMKDNEGNTAYDWARSKKHDDLVLLLRSKR